MSLLIKNGEIITASDRYTADIYCENEQITRIAQAIDAPSGATVVDASGKYVFPGFIDPHVHIYLPFMGTYAKDTYETGSKAALVGGTTCFIDFAIPDPGEDPMNAYETWRGKSDGQSACDYTFHCAVTQFDEKIAKSLREVVRKGIASFKVFLAYKGALGIPDEELYPTLQLAKELGVITTAHCENADLVLELQKRYVSAGKTEPKWHYHTRPEWVEAEGTGHLCSFARAHDAHVYIVHLSCRDALEEALRARAAGVKVWVETLIQFLLLDKSYAEQETFEAAKYVMSPALKEKWNQDVMWNAVQHRLVNTVGTDHAPFDFGEQKPMGKDDFTKIPNGIPAIEDRVNLLYTYGVVENRIDLHTFVDCASTQPAKIFGLFPRKGAIQVGADADICVYDPQYEGQISAKTHLMNVDYSGFEGWTIKGRPHVVTVRGEIAVQDGQFVGTIGRGAFVQREPTHF